MAIVDFSELHVVEPRAVLQKIHNAHGVCVSPAVFHGDFRGNVLQPCVEVDSSFFFQFQQCERHNVLLMEPTRNSVSQAISLFAARSALPRPPHHSSCPFQTSATPAPVTWFFSTTSFMAFCNSSSVLGCDNSSIFCSACGAAETKCPEAKKQKTIVGNKTRRMKFSLADVFSVPSILSANSHSFKGFARQKPFGN